MTEARQRLRHRVTVRRLEDKNSRSPFRKVSGNTLRFVVAGDIELHSTRAFAAESFTFAVRAEDPEVRDAVEILFSDLPDGYGTPTEFSILGQARKFKLEGPEPWPSNGERDGNAVLNDLVTAVNRKRLDAGANRLHLHAGLVAKDGVAVLIAGASGRGKTTLVATLALRGWIYLTDEATSIKHGDPIVRAFPKPITVKEPGTELFPELADHRVTIGNSGTGLWNVPLGRLGVSTGTAAEPTLVVLLSRGNTAVPSWEPMRPADAVVELVEQTLDLERFGDDALLALAELCSRRRCVYIESGTPQATARLVEELAADDMGANLVVARVPMLPNSIAATDDVVAVAIGDEAVLRHRGTGQVISLNPAATEIWATVAGPTTKLGALSPEQATFVRDLAALGFVELPDDMVLGDDA